MGATWHKSALALQSNIDLYCYSISSVLSSLAGIHISSLRSRQVLKSLNASTRQNIEGIICMNDWNEACLCSTMYFLATGECWRPTTGTYQANDISQRRTKAGLVLAFNKMIQRILSCPLFAVLQINEVSKLWKLHYYKEIKQKDRQMWYKVNLLKVATWNQFKRLQTLL